MWNSVWNDEKPSAVAGGFFVWLEDRNLSVKDRLYPTAGVCFRRIGTIRSGSLLFGEDMSEKLFPLW